MSTKTSRDDRQDDPRPNEPEGAARQGDDKRQARAADTNAPEDGRTDGVSSDRPAQGGAPDDDATPSSKSSGQRQAPRDVEAELAEAKDRWLRARAELENVRRGARRDVEEAHAYGAASLLREVVSLLDDLQRALAAAPDDADAGLLEGLRNTEQKFQGLLDRQGVKPVPCEPGTPLDPECHRALVEQPTGEHPPGTIVTEISRGYRLRERLLREAEVVVARAPEADAAPEPDADKES
ncbi:MAG: nucleotide exchange factor GrpE [Planctomycetota bacterium]|nr:MAG: nucleotide exchange factor GrpE [Planctomycetota bacterium]